MSTLHRGTAPSRLLRGLRRLGLGREQAAHWPMRPVARLLSHSGIIPLHMLSGAPLDVVFRVRLPQASFRYHVAPDDLLGARLFWQDWKHWEPDAVPPFARFAGKAQRVLDVGAHTGLYTLYACALNPDAEVYSFEPLPGPYSRLVENAQLNAFSARCKTFQAAVSNEAGEARFHVAEDPTMSRLVDSGGELQVPVMRLDEIVPLDGKTKFVKIDVEGHEYHALVGMEKIIANSHPVILFECNPGGRGPEIAAFLRERGYQILHLAHGAMTSIPELIPERFPHGYHNFLAL